MRPLLNIGHHDHCFDGVASSATFLRFYREKVRPVADEQLGIVGLAHKAGKLFGEEVYAGEENVILDFRYAQDPRLTWWFDHHQSAFEHPGDEAHFRADTTGRRFWDPTAKSCTRFLARVATEKFGFDQAPLQELIHWAEIIDGALFPDAASVVELREPAYHLMTLIEASKDPQLCPRLIRELSHRTLSQVIAEPWVQTPLQPILENHHRTVATVKERLHVDQDVAFVDLTDTNIEGANKFIAYAADPNAIYTVTVTKAPGRSKISLGSNPWRQDQRRHNLAKMAERFGGGGHPPVAAISFKPDEVERARSVARDLAAELKK